MKDLDEIYADTWNRRNSNIGSRGGSMTYEQYLASEHWKKIKAKARKRPNYQKCEFCNNTKVELHHTNYKWILTNDELRAIISLCRFHHQEVHNFAKSKQVSVRIATNTLRNQYKEDYRTPNRIT